MDKRGKAEPSNQPATCPNCESRDIKTSAEQQTFLYGKQGVELKACVPVHTCKGCGFQFTDYAAEIARDRAIRQYLDVPSAEEIEKIRKRYALSRVDFGEITGIGSASLARWESDLLIPNLANARYLYLLGYQENLERLRARYASGPLETVTGAPRQCRMVFRSISNIDFVAERGHQWRLRRKAQG